MKDPIHEAIDKTKAGINAATLDILEGRCEVASREQIREMLGILRNRISTAYFNGDARAVLDLSRERTRLQRILKADICLGLRRPLVFFDMETTGLDPIRDHIVEFAAVKVFPLVSVSPEKGELPQEQQPEEELSLLIDPGVPIQPEATAVHGIDDARVAGCPRLEDVAPRIRDFLVGCDLAGFNIKRFDLPMLLAKLADHGCPLSTSDVLVIDSCDIFHRREPRTLEAAVRFYTGGRHHDKHVAMADVRATMAVLDAQLAFYEDLPRDVVALHAEYHDKDAIDLSGKLRYRHGVPCINFGKYRGQPLSSMQSSYLRWMLDERVVSDDAVPLLREMLARRSTKEK